MRILLLSYLGLLSANIVLCAKGAVRLNVLSTNGVDSKRLYSRLQSTKTRSKTEPPNADAKKLICHYINTSMSIPSDSRQYIYFSEIYDDLRENFSEIFHHIYEPKPANIRASVDGPDMVYTNPTKPISLLDPVTGEKIEEEAFICLKQVEVENKKIFQEFFVSEEYNVSEHPSNGHSAGRFIFKYNDEDQLEVKMLAEEPATPVFVGRKKFVEVELDYKKRRRAPIMSIENESDDSICSLNENQRVRICNLVFNSANFDGELSFLEIPLRTKPCVKQTISFQTLEEEQVDPNVSIVAQNYEELMFECVPYNYDSSLLPRYWVSKDYGISDAVFVYRSVERNEPIVQLLNLFRNIRIKSV